MDVKYLDGSVFKTESELICGVSHTPKHNSPHGLSCCFHYSFTCW